MPFFETDHLSSAEAIGEAQRIAFAPMVFQASRSLRTLGILTALDSEAGATQETVVARTGLPTYGVRVLLEAGLGIGLLTCREEIYRLTKVGWFVLHDRMTIANMDFANDICYEGMADLDNAVADGTAAGLRAFGQWSTIYQALTHLSDTASRSWYAFDHYYSDDAYTSVLPIVTRDGPKSILDIGGNTGRFALRVLRYDPSIHIGIVDLPDMTRKSAATIGEHGFADRVTFYPTDLLDDRQGVPGGYDAVWMSQILDCFSEREVVAILTKVREALSDDARLFIMEPFWDRQRREIAAFCLQMTSLYFTSIANGNSQLYSSQLFLRLVHEAGLVVTDQIDNIGICQSLLICRRACLHTIPSP